jgi:oxygen-independent coproporphyrinogen-3 oxidase
VTEDAAGIYVHIPFCLTRCGYCDFNAYAGLDHLQNRYVSALLREAELAAPDWAEESFVSVFLGGGTPTIGRGPEDLSRTCGLTSSRPRRRVSSGPTPTQSTPRSGLLNAGFAGCRWGRSFDPAVLVSLERLHDPTSVRGAMRDARAAGYANVNLDLIYGADGERIESWERTLRETIDLAPEHVSAYALTIVDAPRP